MRAATSILLSLTLLAASGCEAPTLDAPARCVAVSGDPTPAPEAVCARLASLECRLEDCAGSYARYRARVHPDEFNRLTSCYMRAGTCQEVSDCARGCGADGGAVRLGDASADVTDASTPDAPRDVSLQREDLAALDAEGGDVSDAPLADAADVLVEDAADASMDDASDGATD